MSRDHSYPALIMDRLTSRDILLLLDACHQSIDSYQQRLQDAIATNDFERQKIAERFLTEYHQIRNRLTIRLETALYLERGSATPTPHHGSDGAKPSVT